MPESFDEWWEIFQEGIGQADTRVRSELEERVAEAPTASARQAAQDDLNEYLSGLEEYDQWTAFESLKELAETDDEWSRVQDAYEELTGHRHRASLGGEGTGGTRYVEDERLEL